MLIDFLKTIFRAFSSKKKLNYYQLTEIFKGKYNNFREILYSNHKALSVMYELEENIYSDTKVGFTYLRIKITSLLVNVYKIITNLIELSDGKYKILEQRFDAIKDKINTELERLTKKKQYNKFCIDYSDKLAEEPSIVGNKMSNLVKIKRYTDINIPPFFIITSYAFNYILDKNGLKDKINTLLYSIDIDNISEISRVSKEIKDSIMKANIPKEIEEEIYSYLLKLGQLSNIKLAIRSSSTIEDSRSSSFAGQFESKLNVTKDEIITAYKEVVASLYNDNAIYYRLLKGYREEDISMCVGCMIMIDPKLSGVIYTANPINNNINEIIITISEGLAKNVVDGSNLPSTFSISKKNGRITELTTSSKKITINDKNLNLLKDTAIKLEEFFNIPLDIEWSIDKNDTLFILQCRPLIDYTLPEIINRQELLKDKKKILSGGVCVSKGIDYGKPIFDYNELSNNKTLKKVLVVKNASPEYALVLPKVSAIITEYGSIASHLATVAREFKIPAIFGLKDATNILKNFSTIIVDADETSIYEGTITDNIITNFPKKREKIYNNDLSNLLNLITPLNLIDPNSPYFRASSCQTLHDITRFCHEKALEEITKFGEKNHFFEKCAKKIVTNANQHLEWWVINLADGFKADYISALKFINISDVVSLPMLALWEGITFEPWEGPPPIDLKGLGSVIISSTMNPALIPELPSNFAIKNYFLITKNYCHLSMKLGYHFSTVEAMVTDDVEYNYISLNFRGGAADKSRRELRVQLLADILQKYNFKTDVQSDSLFARDEFLEKQDALNKLKIIGYLLIHSRQIDMVMQNPKSVELYRNKLQHGIERILKNR